MSSFPTDKHYLHAPSLDNLPHIEEILLHRICRLPDPVIPTKEPGNIIHVIISKVLLKFLYLNTSYFSIFIDQKVCVRCL